MDGTTGFNVILDYSFPKKKENKDSILPFPFAEASWTLAAYFSVVFDLSIGAEDDSSFVSNIQQDTLSLHS